MRKQTFDSLKKNLAILLLVLFVISATATAASALKKEKTEGEQEGKQEGDTEKVITLHGHDRENYLKGYKTGYAAGINQQRIDGPFKMCQSRQNLKSGSATPPYMTKRVGDSPLKAGFVYGFNQGYYKGWKELCNFHGDVAGVPATS